MIQIKGRKFIVACDDFGISERANRNILELVSKNKIDRVAVMMGASISVQEVQTLLTSGVKLDIHLHLNNGQACSCHEKVGGVVSRSISFLWSYFSGERRNKIVEEKWRAQIADFKKIFGKNPDGLNSHEHFHFFPPYFRIASRLGKELSLPYFRFGKRGIVGNNSTSFILKVLRMFDKLAFSATSLPSSDYMISFDWVSSLEILAQKFPTGSSIELVFHPEREDEFEFLKQYK